MLRHIKPVYTHIIQKTEKKLDGSETVVSRHVCYLEEKRYAMVIGIVLTL